MHVLQPATNRSSTAAGRYKMNKNKNNSLMRKLAGDIIKMRICIQGYALHCIWGKMYIICGLHQMFVVAIFTFLRPRTKASHARPPRSRPRSVRFRRGHQVKCSKKPNP